MKTRRFIGLALLAASVSGCASMANSPSALDSAIQKRDTNYIGAVNREAKRGVSFVQVYWVNPPSR